MEKLERIGIIRAEAEAYVYPTEDEKVLRELKTREEQVEYLLKKYPESRNNDFYLQWVWLRTFAKLDLPWLKWEEFWISGKLGTVTRVRRRIQNEKGLLLPTDPKVFQKRQSRSEAMRKAFIRLKQEMNEEK